MAKPGAPIVFTVPVGKIRKWYPLNTYRGKGVNFPSLYLFNPGAVKELESLTSKVELVTNIPANYNQLFDIMIKEFFKLTVQVPENTRPKSPHIHRNNFITAKSS